MASFLTTLVSETQYPPTIILLHVTRRPKFEFNPAAASFSSFTSPPASPTADYLKSTSTPKPASIPSSSSASELEFDLKWTANSMYSASGDTTITTSLQHFHDDVVTSRGSSLPSLRSYMPVGILCVFTFYSEKMEAKETGKQVEKENNRPPRPRPKPFTKEKGLNRSTMAVHEAGLLKEEITTNQAETRQPQHSAGSKRRCHAEKRSEETEDGKFHRIWNIWAVMRNEELFECPDEFWPETEEEKVILSYNGGDDADQDAKRKAAKETLINQHLGIWVGEETVPWTKSGRRFHVVGVCVFDGFGVSVGE
ncbi:hypothetical protein D9758_009832 [Tetrapyrgos nigripes]|uniref:Uncharacterized protein n=1 Tax=Tetrapyrgos nigripes TaxID=182062 RepID=A0A8H5GM94_9AGAR|nr:hypothetical protein D9758_009832 [Tetrapyrgos nigripes]